MQGVAAALGDDGHEAASAATVFRFGAERLDLDILDGVVVEARGEHAAAKRVGDVHPVELGAVLGGAARVHAWIDVALIRTDEDARHQRPDVLVAALRADRKRGQRGVVDVDGESRAFRIDRRAFTRDGDGLVHRANAQREVERRHGAKPDRNGLQRSLESLDLGPRLVSRGRQVVQPVETLCVRDGDEGAQCFRALERHGHAGKNAAARVSNLAEHRAGAAGLSARQHGKRHEHCKEQHRNSSSHHSSS